MNKLESEAREFVQTHGCDPVCEKCRGILNGPHSWEMLNPDWTEDGDLTERFAKSQFADCPACGKFEHLEVLNTSYDDPGACVLCRPCQIQANGECPCEAVENWNKRVDGRVVN